MSGGSLVPQRLAQGLQRRGHDVAVFAGYFDAAAEPPSSWTTTDGQDDGDGSGVPVTWVVTTPWTQWSHRRNYRNPAVTKAFVEWLEQFGPDVVHFHSLQSLGAGLVEAAADRGIATVVTLHDFWWWCGRQFLVDRKWCPCSPVVAAGVCSCEVDRPWLDARNAYLAGVLDRADLILTVSETLARVARANGVTPDLVVVDENGVPGTGLEISTVRRKAVPPASTSTLTEPPERVASPVTLAYLGGPSEMKGPGTLLEAVRQLRDVEGWTSTWYGCANWLAEHAPDLGLPLVEAPPSFDPADIDAVMAAADAVVIPSLMRESYSLVTREALIRGLPVITTDCFGPEEVVTHEVNGLVVTTGDADALADAMRRIILDDGLRSRLGREGASVAVRSVDEQLDGLEVHYRRLLAPTSASREAPAPAPAPAIERVLFIAGMDGAPLRYRGHLAAEGLRDLGVATELRHYRHPDVAELSTTADALIVYRVPATVQMAAVIEAARRRKIPVLFDADDLIFDADLRNEIPALAILPPKEVELWLEGVQRYRATLEHCDAFIGSTAMPLPARLGDHRTAGPPMGKRCGHRDRPPLGPGRRNAAPSRTAAHGLSQRQHYPCQGLGPYRTGDRAGARRRT